MYSENFVKYLLRYQADDFEQKDDNKNNENKQEKLHFGFIYSKIIKNNYAPVPINVR